MWRSIRERIFVVGLPDWLRWLDAQIPAAVPWYLALQRAIVCFCFPLLLALFVLAKLIGHGGLSQATNLTLSTAIFVGFVLFSGTPGLFALVLGTLGLSRAVTHRGARTTQTALFVLTNYALAALCALCVCEWLSLIDLGLQKLQGTA